MGESLTGIVATGFFRTGSTLIFSCLRQVQQFQCFYEPYHPELLDFVKGLDDASVNPDKHDLDHVIEGDYFEEYRGIDIESLEQSLALEKRVTNHPVLFSGSSNQELEDYIRFLLNFSESADNVPVLQANRFNFALPWLRSRFPQLLRVLITRDPRQVFLSLRKLAHRRHAALEFDTRVSDFWNVHEAFSNIVNRYGFNRSQVKNFGYYQKLFFILRFSEWEMSKDADIVIDHNEFCANYEVILNALVEPFDFSAEKATAYANMNVNVSEVRAQSAITQDFDEYEEEVRDIIYRRMVSFELPPAP